MADELSLSIDAADDAPGVALSRDGRFLQTKTWRTERNHSVELLPAIDNLLTEVGRLKSDLTAVFVDVGPGGYAALRVAVSIAKAISHGLQIPLVAIGRLELDAYLVRQAATDRRIVAAHESGRGEIAWAAYSSAAAWREESQPTIAKAEDFANAVRPSDVLTGDFSDDLVRNLLGNEAPIVRPTAHRLPALAELGAQRFAGNRTDDPVDVVPLYLRAPAIGPQR